MKFSSAFWVRYGNCDSDRTLIDMTYFTKSTRAVYLGWSCLLFCWVLQQQDLWLTPQLLQGIHSVKLNLPVLLGKKSKIHPVTPIPIAGTEKLWYYRRRSLLLSLSLCSGLLPRRQIVVEALQVCCLLLPPANRRKLQLLMRLMTKACINHHLPSLNDTIGTRTLVIYIPGFL